MPPSRAAIEERRQASQPLTADIEIGPEAQSSFEVGKAAKPTASSARTDRPRYLQSWSELSKSNASFLVHAAAVYFRRWKGCSQKHPPRAAVYKAGLAWVGCFCSILLVGGIFTWIDYSWSLPLMLASFGPTAALLYGTPSLPAAQPWNAMGGTILSGVVGLLFRVLLGHKAWIARPLSVATSVALLALAAAPFPPGAATALLLTTIAPQSTFPVANCDSGNCYNNAAAWCIFSSMEHSYLTRLIGGCKILLANIIGQTVMVVVALLVDNLDPKESYPQRWL